MIQHQPICNDDRLREMLRTDESCDPALLEHIETCSHCQQRLDELAADGLEWTRAVDLLSSNARVAANGHGRAAELRAVTWTESMAQELLSPSKHSEMLGRIGRYDVERIIGSGGMGIVFRAHDTELNRPVAIKLLAPYLASSGTAKNRFAREARAAAGVVDDHVVPIFNVESEAEPPFLVMQYIGGGSLQEKLDQHGPLEAAEVVRIGLQVAKGLAAAHAQGLIHRDVKPSNILLDEGVERAMLTDFGLARTESDACLTRSGFHPGTPHYMSPEQVRGETLDSRSDLFGLGCVLYAACVGHPPFRAESSYAVLRRITDDSPRSVRELNTNIPEWLERIVMVLLSKNRDHRFESATEVAELLERCLAHLQAPTTQSLPAAVAKLSKDSGPGGKQSESRGGFRFTIKVGAVMLAIPLMLAGIFIALETSKGTITIESEADHVPIVIKKGGVVYDKLTVHRDGKQIRLFAGRYEVTFDGDIDRFTMEDGAVHLQRGKESIVQIRSGGAADKGERSDDAIESNRKALSDERELQQDRLWEQMRQRETEKKKREEAAQSRGFPSGGNHQLATESPVDSQDVPRVVRVVARSNEFQWSEKTRRDWRVGVRVLERPDAKDSKLVLEYALRNEAAKARDVELSFNTGKLGLQMRGGKQLRSGPGLVGSRSHIEVFQVEPGKEQRDPRFRQEFDFTGFREGEYRLRLGSYFFVRDEEKVATRRGLPAPPELTLSLERRQNEVLDGADEVQWGPIISGLRLGAKFIKGQSGDKERITISHGATVELQLFVQNATDRTLACQVALPHSMDGWTMGIYDSKDAHVDRFQVFYSAYQPQIVLAGNLDPGEIQPITSKLDKFKSAMWWGESQKAVRFVVRRQPKKGQAKPPFVYGLKEGKYTVQISASMKRNDMPGASINLETKKLPFHVVASEGDEATAGG